MASIISAGTTSGTALNFSGDTSGVLQLASNGTTTALSISTAQVVTLTNALPVTSGGTGVTTSTGTGNNVLATSPTITTPTISQLTSASATALTLQSAGTTAITVDTSQNVGIGTTSPTSAGSRKTLTVNGASGADFYLQYGGTEVLSIQATSATAPTINYPASGSLAFQNGSERMRIDSSGNLLVGATATIASERLNLTNGGTTLGMYVKYTTAPNASGNEFIYCGDSSTARAYIKSNGGFANYSANNTNLSDVREKKNIELSGNYLDKICAIPVKTFLYNDQTDTDLNLGAIAQDVQAVCPELVMESNWANKDELEKMRLSIYQTDLQYALMKSIQELKQINDTQAETINALTARIVALEQA